MQKTDESKSHPGNRETLRERILNMAMAAFAEKGIRAVKMDSIARELGISKRTLYEVYDNKEDLLFEGIKKFKEMKEREAQVIASRGSDVMDIILQLYRVRVEEFKHTNPTFFSDIKKYPRVVAFLNADHDDSLERFRLFLRRGVREGFFRRDIDYELVVMVFDGITRTINEQQLYERYSVEHIFHNVVFVPLRGICTHKGAESLGRF